MQPRDRLASTMSVLFIVATSLTVAGIVNVEAASEAFKAVCQGSVIRIQQSET